MLLCLVRTEGSSFSHPYLHMHSPAEPPVSDWMLGGTAMGMEPSARSFTIPVTCQSNHKNII